MPCVDHDRMTELFQPDFERGKLFWKERSENLFRNNETVVARRILKAWNTRHSGKEAFTAVDGGGYKYGCVLGKNYLAHRVLWLLHTGAWPVGNIDHINGNTADNAIKNLRDVSQSENLRNRKISSANTSGAPGVSFFKKTNKWKATITTGEGRVHLGYFDSFDAALSARDQVAIISGYIDRR